MKTLILFSLLYSLTSPAWAVRIDSATVFPGSEMFKAQIKYAYAQGKTDGEVEVMGIIKASKEKPQYKNEDDFYQKYFQEKISTFTLPSDPVKDFEEAAEREKRSNPGYDVDFSSLTIDGWHCVDRAPFEFGPNWSTPKNIRCLREEGYRSDGVVVWRKP